MPTGKTYTFTPGTNFARSDHAHGLASDWINVAFDITGTPAEAQFKLITDDLAGAPKVESVDRYANWKTHHGVHVPPSFKPKPPESADPVNAALRSTFEKWLGSYASSPTPWTWSTTTPLVYSTSTTNVEAPPVVAPEIVQEDLPILAHRWCNLRVRDDVGVCMTSLNDGYVVPAAGYAECHCPGRMASQVEGEAPHYDGTCGWYSVPADQMGEYHGDVSLLVELYGRVIECERGYRAQYQRIVEMQAPPCRFCRKPSEVAHFDTDKFECFTCTRHAGRSGWGTFWLDELGKHLGVQISQQD